MAIMTVLYGCGLRRSEVALLELSDYDPSVREVYVHHAQTGRVRTCYVQTVGELAGTGHG